MPSRTCIIFNPAARGEKAQRFRERLSLLSTECTLKPTLAAGSGRALAAEAVQAGYESIVAAGGDGTVNEVINGIGDEPQGFARARLGVLPLGTVNVFAREIGLPLNWRAWEVIQQGHEARIDLARAQFAVGGREQQRYFLQMAGAGFDARANALVNWELKKRIGVVAYILAGLKAMRGPLPQITVCTGQETARGQLVLIGNGRLYGGNFPLFPLADFQDGLLEITIFPRVNALAVLRAFGGLMSSRLYSIGGALYLKASNASLSCPGPIPFHVEGENTGTLPAQFSVCPEKLRVLVPVGPIR